MVIATLEIIQEDCEIITHDILLRNFMQPLSCIYIHILKITVGDKERNIKVKISPDFTRFVCEERIQLIEKT